ncbi:MAG TPA: response regulator [Thermoanaerobaculia bacterium]|nr:response regulator [Thermoanaerobaculia bacterium]
MTGQEQLDATTVLVVEDDAALQTLFLALLTRQGFDVECVDNGAQAIERLSHKSYSVMLLDLMLPVCNGFDVLVDLAAKQSPVLRRTVVATGVSERELARIDASRVFAVLRKPFDIDCLVQLVRQCANQHAQIRREESDDEEEEVLDSHATRLETALPMVNKLLLSPVVAEGELLLRSELRRTIHRTAAALTTAATLEADDARAARLARLANRAEAIVRSAPRNRRDH